LSLPTPAFAPAELRVLIVKLSSLGDVVHAMPVVHDILRAYPGALIDWVVEPAFARLVKRVDGINAVIECSLRRWSKRWWTRAARAEWHAFRLTLGAVKYDAVIDLQGLTKSAVVARLAHGVSYGMAHATDGSSFEAPARWLVDHPIRLPAHVHAVDRSRQLAAAALKFELQGSPQYGLSATAGTGMHNTVVFVHGTSRVDKLWPQTDWIALGKALTAQGWRIALPRTGDVERERAYNIASGINSAASGQAQVWPAMNLDDLIDRLRSCQAVIGVDSGLSHIAVALNLPHVQIYNFPTAWRTGPQPAHRRFHQMSVEGSPAPSLEAVSAAWQQVAAAAGLPTSAVAV
jgi:heptosyltransferase I